MSLAMCSVLFWYGMCARSWSAFKILKTYDSNPSGPDELKESLQFWTCFAVLALFDFYVEFLFSWIPLYPMAKMGLLWYIITPSTKGSEVVFNQVLAPKFEQKLMNLEKIFLVDLLASFVELDWMYEQLTTQLGTRLASVSREQLVVLNLKLGQLQSSIERELNQRRLVQPVMALAVDDDFEFVRESRTPSPQERPVVAKSSAKSTRSTPPKSAETSRLSTRSAAESSRLSTKSAAAASRSPAIQPSFLPSRGIQVGHILRSSPAVVSPVTTRSPSPEDVQDETLRSMELDETLMQSREAIHDSLVSTPSAVGNSSSASKATLQTPFTAFTRRFSWMSPRWPAFSASSKDDDDDDDDDDEDYKANDGEYSSLSDDSSGNIGPVTRSKARQQRVSQRQLGTREAAIGRQQTKKKRN